MLRELLIYLKMSVIFSVLSLSKLAGGLTKTVIALTSITDTMFIRARLPLNMNIALMYGSSTCS